jgi:hypothetical protein
MQLGSSKDSFPCFTRLNLCVAHCSTDSIPWVLTLKGRRVPWLRRGICPLANPYELWFYNQPSTLDECLLCLFHLRLPLLSFSCSKIVCVWGRGLHSISDGRGANSTTLYVATGISSARGGGGGLRGLHSILSSIVLDIFCSSTWSGASMYIQYIMMMG